MGKTYKQSSLRLSNCLVLYHHIFVLVKYVKRALKEFIKGSWQSVLSPCFTIQLIRVFKCF